MQFNRNTVFVIIFNSLLTFGCFWHLLNVCKLYFEYPTSISMDTKIDPFSKPVPAITLVTNIGHHSFVNSTDVMKNESAKFKYKMFKSILIERPSGQRYSLLREYLASSIERISESFYSITLNSVIKGLIYQDHLKINI